MSSYRLFVALLASVAGALAISACSTLDASTNETQYENESDPCDGCRLGLVDCISRTNADTGFVECRDEFLGCQQSAGLSVGKCSNPADSNACTLCAKRFDQCSMSEDAVLCSMQFDTCKARLMRNEDARQECGSLVDTPAVPEACRLCKSNYASCMSDATAANTTQVCETLFMECGLTTGVSPEECPKPSAKEACSLCITEHDNCSATTDTPSCWANFTFCAEKLASEYTCELPESGSGGAGGGGQGGAGGAAPSAGSGGGAGTDNCLHDTCEVGPALTPECSPCATAVCDVDAYCCDNEWDAKCVEWATKLKHCECTP